MKKGSKMTVEQRKNVSNGVKTFFKTHTVWNKGKKFSVHTEPAYVRLRRNKEYYEKELEKNALRAHRKGYYKDEAKLMQATKLTQQRRDRIGYFGKRDWTEDELKYLIDNYKSVKYEDICKVLNRSYCSVYRKIGRLKLKKNKSYIV